ncbi:pectate lyase [Leuconostoc litchii]|uniref:Pectate lyase n=1 Tax=Leuconostoc litchii TaxID=1981069 RepID=A0A652NDJ8_9LACO|nr:pectate lyase [Leuconostoc litchii]TYC45965.1 pectate lyase [Leuconostoc litchii]GMA70864.1 pectate lyase [Leuconostoc litchii]
MKFKDVEYSRFRYTVAIILGLNVINISRTIHAATISPSLQKTAREVANSSQGFASGTSGGTKADNTHIYTVSNRADLMNALGDQNNQTAKIIYISGTIDMNIGINGKTLTATDYANGTGYNFTTYLNTYNPAKYGKKIPAGTQEIARDKAQKNQAKQIQYKVPSNTTIIGTNNAKITGGNMIINGSNVIVRNINFENAYDYFPQWDPTDGNSGNWNSQYDNLTVTGGSNVWLDHNQFSDGSQTDNKNGSYYGREYQHHDGLVDIVNGANNVTLSYNQLQNHDKSMNIGNSDSKTSDLGKLQVTMHHNRFDNLIQRQPRVRFGKVHIYNNYYSSSNSSIYKFMYAFGIGKQSQIYAQNNTFDVRTASINDIAKVFGGTNFTDNGNLLNGKQVEGISKLNKLNPVTFSPNYKASLQDLATSKNDVNNNAGPILK